MNQFELGLATPADDAGLRELLSATPMQGDISFAFAREPNYFAAASLDGEFVQVVIARDRISKRIVGMGSRAISNCFVNGMVQAVGYLSALRILPEYRGHAGLLMRGYRYFRELHADGRAAFYLTTIAADNKLALKVLTSQRAGLPTYLPIGRFNTLAISHVQRVNIERPPTIAVRNATPGDAEAILRFLHDAGPRRQFFPAYVAGNGVQWLSRLLGLEPNNLLLAFDGDQLVGTLGVWDQRMFKQTIVTGYSQPLKSFRLPYNVVARLCHRPILPHIGQPLDLRYAAVFVVAEDRQEIADPLLAAAIETLHVAGEKFLAVGLHEADPLLPVVRRYSGREYATLLYLVYWPDEVPNYLELMSRVPYLELGCL